MLSLREIFNHLINQGDFDVVKADFEDWVLKSEGGEKVEDEAGATLQGVDEGDPSGDESVDQEVSEEEAQSIE